MSQASEYYELGLKAYNGDELSREKFFDIFSKVVIPIAKVYGLLPSFVMAKAVIESGWFTNKWNDTFRELTGCIAVLKAQTFNNVFSMNAWGANKRYLNNLPTPNWVSYGATFYDYGPHWKDGKLIGKFEPWKSYESLEDAVEDWCANMRGQAEEHGYLWVNTDLVTQLLATESFTPEGQTSGVRKPLHFDWQEQVMQYYERYSLAKYDKETEMNKVPMTVDNFTYHVRKAYEFAHQNCHYAPCLAMPPMFDGCADCVGLAFRALYTMGYMTEPANINMIGKLCEASGMVMSKDENDIWRHTGVVCYQDNHLVGTPNVSHVYVTLGGKNLNDITKYDLGSGTRIKSLQPYENVKANEWPGKRKFMVMFYVKPDVSLPEFEGRELFVSKTKRIVNLRSGAGKDNTLLMKIPKGVDLPVYGVVSTTGPNIWFYTSYNGIKGWVYRNNLSYAAKPLKFKKYVVDGVPDNCLACRTGAGVNYPLFKNHPYAQNGDAYNVFAKLVAKDGSEWFNVKGTKYYYFVSAMWLRRRP